MKPFISSLIFLLLTLSSFSNAQDKYITKGLYRLSGSVGMSYDHQKYETSDFSVTDFFFSPGVSYLVTDNIELGITIGYDYEEQKTTFTRFPDEIKNIYSSFSIGPGIRYYFSNTGIIPFAGASFAYNAFGFHGSSKNEMSRVSVAFGISYFLSNSVALEPSVSYGYTFGKDDFTSSQIRIAAGINYFIRN